MKLNQNMLNQFMKQMKVENIDANKVIIETSTGKMIFDDPQVVKMGMKGQESFSVTGEFHEEGDSDFSEDDVKLVMEKTGKSKSEVIKVLEAAKGDIAEAIMKLGK